jgi:predicted dehydrogenase
MRFALLGNHSDGIELAEALVASGRHQVVAYSRDDQRLRALDSAARRVGDVEEILADPSVEAIVVAGSIDSNPALLRRALQSERPVLCVHPPGDGPEIAYEAGMIRDDVHCALLPILTEARHPAIHRLAEFVWRGKKSEPSGPVGQFLLLEIERAGPGSAEAKAAFPCWDVLRALGGEVAELSAFAEDEEVNAAQPVSLSGRFERGGLFQMTLLPLSRESPCRLVVVGAHGRAELHFPIGMQGPAFLDWTDSAGTPHEEYWPPFDPFPALIEAFESAVSGQPAAVSWQDCVRALELDDAARRSLRRRRASLLEYPDATEEVGFKGTMTLVGCALLWAVLLLLILAVWVPWLGWAIVPLLVVFLGLQLLRYVLPGPPRT